MLPLAYRHSVDEIEIHNYIRTDQELLYSGRKRNLHMVKWEINIHVLT